MRTMKTATNYWFAIEPYIFVGLTKQRVLLYNTLDGVSVESDKTEVVELMLEILQAENCGVVLLTNERYKQKYINGFINDLREKFMGDFIDIDLSKGKPIQLMPYFNYPDKQAIYKKHNFSTHKDVLECLSEISIHVDGTIDVPQLLSFLQSIPGNPIFNLVGNMDEVEAYSELLLFFDKHSSPKNIVCSYKNVIALQPAFENNFAYRISVNLPIEWNRWQHMMNIILKQTLPVEYIFNISSEEDHLQVEKLIEQFSIENYRLHPVYNGDNIHFFEENVFLSKEDILSTSMSIKDFFSRQVMNIYDFGKINIMPDGETYANLNYSSLGNIYTDSIYEIVQKEIDEGKSWFRIRNQAPCDECVYQWLCPSPSNYEMDLGRPNLCNVKKNK